MLCLEACYKIFRDAKWVILIVLLLCFALIGPNQVIELYRISAIEGGTQTVILFSSVATIGLACWLGSVQVLAKTRPSLRKPCPAALNLIRYLPAVLGAAPILVVALALFQAQPDLETIPEEMRKVGSVLRIQHATLTEVQGTLQNQSFWCLALALLMLAGMSILTAWTYSWASRANAAYFIRRRFLFITLVIVVGCTVLFVYRPVDLPSKLTPFGVLALFAVCIVALCVHASLVTIRDRIPYIPLCLLFILLLSYLDLNDNHHLRPLVTQTPSQDSLLQVRPTAKVAFQDWLRQRGLGSADGVRSTYPVFVVTAQGGGIYAAYNAAVFLARMQDLCPKFHQHLFAISGVSGGSVGAATFAAALDASNKVGPRPGDVAQDPCPLMTRFLSNAHADALDNVGEMEASIDLALSSDFLSPLLAGTLFPDFLQSIIPRGVANLDRARALEYALESAARQMYVRKETGSGTGQTKQADKDHDNLLSQSFQSYWQPGGAIPALLLNATDSGTGKRVVMAPFNLQKAAETSSDVCMLTPTKQSEDFALSTAAFVSARFPWVTPAATIRSVNSCMGDKKVEKIRLVDGGYIDNSGIETALEVIAEMKEALKSSGDAAIAQFPVYLISLSSDDFPNVRAYSLNELLEPIRALLNGREARAAIAVNRARTNFDIIKVDENELPRFNRTNLQNYFYDLPLGWAMSERTRDIIALDSGRFWDCRPTERFTQAEKGLGNADCVQLHIYHLLNNSARSALVGLKAANSIADRMKSLAMSGGASKETLSHESVLACYENYLQENTRARWKARQAAYEQRVKKAKEAGESSDAIKPPTPYKTNYLSYHQAEHVRALLGEWDRRAASIKDTSFLAYILGSLSYDSNDFRRLSENVTFKSAEQIRNSGWKNRIKEIDAKRKLKDPASVDVDLSQFTNSPEKFAELVWGWEDNWFGNNKRGTTYQPDLKEGWKYRTRGVYHIVGREQYLQEDVWLRKENPRIDLNLLENEPDSLFNSAISAKVAFSHFMNWRSPRLPTAPRADDLRTLFRKEHGLERKTVADVLSAHPGKFAMARANQTDMGDERKIVTERSEMFQRCIEASPRRELASAPIGGRAEQ